MNLGKFLKIVAVILFSITVMALLFLGIKAINDYSSELTFGGWFALLLASWMSCLTLCAFGELLDRVINIEEYMQYKRYNDTKKNSQTDLWKCKVCGAENPNHIVKCQGCGKTK